MKADYAAMDCPWLYTLATQLDPQSKICRSPVLNGQSHRLAAIIGTVFEPAHYYFALVIPWHMKQRYRAP